MDSNYVCPVRKSSEKESVSRAFPNLVLPGKKWFGLNRISHPDWVKICVDHNGQINLRAKQKYEVLSASIFIDIFPFYFKMDSGYLLQIISRQA